MLKQAPRAWHVALLAGLSLVLAAAAFRDFNPEVVPAWSDYWDYLQLARQVSEGKGFTSLFTYPLFLPYSGDGPAFTMLWRPPGYPLALSAVFLLTGGASLWSPVVLQILGHLVSVLATYWLGLEFVRRRWALLAALVVALSPDLLGMAEPGIATSLFTALLALAVRGVVRAETRARAGLAGGFFGLLALLRGEAVLFYPAMIWLLWAGDRGDRERRIWAFLVGAVLVGLPWVLRNWLVTGRPFFGTSSLIYVDTAAFPGWISSRQFDTLDRSALLWALGHSGQVSWKSLRNAYHFLTQALLLPLPALAPFVWVALSRLSRVGRESAYCAAILIAGSLFIVMLSPLEYSPRLLHPFIPLLAVVGVILLDRIREQVGEGEEAVYSRRPATWVTAAVITLAALQWLGALRESRVQRAAWAAEFGSLAATDWNRVARELKSDRYWVSDYPAYYSWQTRTLQVWLPAGRNATDLSDPRRYDFRGQPAAGVVLAAQRGGPRPDPTGLEASRRLLAGATADTVGGLLILRLPH